jgi:Fe-S-cluster containining protein
MTQDTDAEMPEFFRAQHHVFTNILAQHRGRAELLPTLLTQAFGSYEANVELQAVDYPELACHKGCATCCALRVVATAPEVLLVARFIRAHNETLKEAGVDLKQRLAQADSVTRDCDEQRRVSLRRRCPYIDKGACVIYPVRPLACRSHASYDKRACAEAAAGCLDEIPFSAHHMTVRSLVQNAMQSALRDAGYAWAAYELNHSLCIALADQACEEAWLAGDDVFARALIADISPAEMANTFDHIHRRASSEPN